MTLTNRIDRWLAGTLLLCAWLSSTPLVLGQNTAATANNSAVLVTVAGAVEIAPQGSTAWIPAKAGQILKPGDRVRTGKGSRATIRLSNLSLLRVYQLTTLQIQASAGPNHSLSLESGSAYFFNRDRPTETQFRTPSASGAIRGTEFNLTVKPNGRMELALLDGQVDLTNAQGALQVQSGQVAVADPGQPLKKIPLVNAVNIIQWTLYYPAILDTSELELSADSKQALQPSLDAYNSGNIVDALDKFGDHTPGADAEKVYNGALLLAVGDVDAADQLLKPIAHDSRAGALANALEEMIAAVKGEPWTRTEPRNLATEWMAGSYTAQATRDLDVALSMAKHAVAKDPNFAYAQERLAEMEFSFGNAAPAMAALDKSLSLAPHNAQALALKGFTLAAANKMTPAKDYFDKAIAADGSVANGFLGRGLILIRQGRVNEGRKDLETAASIEPNRAFLRSYLGKAWSLDQPFRYGWNTHLATNELRRSMELDPKDPTAWLYAALLSDQMNCINKAIRDLEHSEELNNNRAVYRSKFMLDQDAAVRSANLARIYEDAGFTDVAVREATKSLDNDYANYSAHLFLSETYDALQDPKREDLRYQTPWEDELLVANLLAPVGAGILSQNISQSEYSRLFESDRVGLISQTEFFSRGAWLENSSEFGVSGPLAFSLEQYYYSDPGWRPNNYIQNSDYDIKVKYQLSPKDTAFLQVERSELQTGDPFQYYNFNTPRTPTVFGYDPGLEEYEQQDPNILAGFRRDWGTGNQTLFLYRGLEDHFSSIDQNYYPPIVPSGAPPGFPLFSILEPSVNNIQRQTELNSFEVQHIYETGLQSVVVGGRYQNESMQTASTLTPGSLFALPEFYYPADTTHFDRFSAYAYDTLKLGDHVRLAGGLTYDYEHYPMNLGQAPLTSQETDKGRLSPKFGLDYVMPDGTRLRAAFSRSMGGLINDSSTTIEPTEIGGFNQSFRSLIPQSSGFGTPPALTFETYGIGLDHKFATGTYVDAEAQLLSSQGSQDVGSYFDAGPGSQTQSQLTQSQYFQEKDAFASISQLLGDYVSVGARYQLTSVDLTADFYSPNVGAEFPQHLNSTLNEASFFGNLYLPCGFFGEAECNWWSQYNTLNAIGQAEGDTGFWQANFYAGYRFPRRHIEMELGLVNAFNHGYNIDPVTYFLEQARTRTLVASLKLAF